MGSILRRASSVFFLQIQTRETTKQRASFFFGCVHPRRQPEYNSSQKKKHALRSLASPFRAQQCCVGELRTTSTRLQLPPLPHPTFSKFFHGRFPTSYLLAPISFLLTTTPPSPTAADASAEFSYAFFFFVFCYLLPQRSSSSSSHLHSRPQPSTSALFWSTRAS